MLVNYFNLTLLIQKIKCFYWPPPITDMSCKYTAEALCTWVWCDLKMSYREWVTKLSGHVQTASQKNPIFSFLSQSKCYFFVIWNSAYSKWHRRPVTVTPAAQILTLSSAVPPHRPSISAHPLSPTSFPIHTVNRGSMHLSWLNRSRTGFTPELLVKSEKLSRRFHNNSAVEFSLNRKTRPVSHFLQEKSSDGTRGPFHIICLLPSDARPPLHLFLEVAIERGTISAQWVFSFPVR